MAELKQITLSFLRYFLILSSYFLFVASMSSSQTMASEKTIRSTSAKNTKKIIRFFKKKGIKYKLKKTYEKVKVFQLILKDAKNYRHSRVKRHKKIYFKNFLYHEQFSSISQKKIIKMYKTFLKKGFLKKHMVILNKKIKIQYYLITYKKKSKKKLEPVDEEVSSNYRIAQSKIYFEAQKQDSDKFSGNYMDLLTGIEIDGESFTGKVMGRFENYYENQDGEIINQGFLNLDESYLNFEVGSGQFTLGKQLFSWGVFDEFSNLDRVSIKNLARFVFDSGENYRRPITAARYEYYFGDWKLDTFVDSGLEPGKEMSEQSLWSGINRATGKVRGASTEVLNPLLVINTKIYFGARDETGFGFRLTKSGEGDLSFSYLNAYPDIPVLKFSELLRSQILLGSVNEAGLKDGVELRYFKENVFGIDYAKTIGEQLYKMEVTYIPNSLVINDQLELIEVPRVRFAVGGDFEFNLFSTTLTWQIISEKLTKDENTLLDDELYQYVLQSSSRFFADKGEGGVRAVINGNDNSNYVSPFFYFDLTDSDRLGLTYYKFNGESESFFGYHKEDDFVNLNYQKLF